MPSAEHSVTINRPPEAVFAYLADGEKCPEWRTGVLDIARVSGDGSVGSVYKQGVSGPMGRRTDADYMVTAYEPFTRYEFQTTAGPVRPRGGYELEEVDGGTRLVFRLTLTLGGITGLLLGRTVQKTMDAEVQAIERLKEVLESESA